MHLQRLWWSWLVAAMLGGLVCVTAVAAASEQFLPLLSVRGGASGLFLAHAPMATLPM